MTSKNRAELLDGLLAEIGTPNGWQSRVSLHPCQGTKFHSPMPLTTRRFEDIALPGEVWLCPTCTSKLEIFLHVHSVDPELLSWDVMREFGNQIRIFGQAIAKDRAAAS